MNDAPIDFTSSADAGRTSYASTTAPSRLAVAMACNPATPAPNTTTRAGGTVPAAVMKSGKNRGNRIAASNAHRYPDTSACDVRRPSTAPARSAAPTPSRRPSPPRPATNGPRRARPTGS